MYDEEQMMHIRRIYVEKYNNKIDKPKPNNKNSILQTCFLYVIISVISQYTIDVISKILQKLPITEWFKVTYSYKVYYAAVITAFINGVLANKITSKLFSIAAVIVASTVYQTILMMTNDEVASDSDYIYGIVRDVFLILLILYIIERLFEDRSEEDTNFSNGIAITIVASVVINLATFLSRSAYSVLDELLFSRQ